MPGLYHEARLAVCWSFQQVANRKELRMPTYIVLGTFTDQGIRAVKDTTKRAEAFRTAAKKAGVTIKDFYWTLGQYDLAFIAEAPDDAAMTAVGLSVGAVGNVRSQTLRAFTMSEMGQVLGKMS